MTRLRIFLSIALVVAFVFANSCSAFAQLPPAEVKRRQLIVVGLPDQVPVVWFSTDPNLVKVRKGNDFTLLSPTSKLFTDRYQSSLGSNYPIVALLRPDGGAIYAADKSSMPSTAGGLFEEMLSAVSLARNAQTVDKPPANIDIPSQLMESVAFDPNCNEEECNPPQGGTILPMLRPNAHQEIDPLDLVERGPRTWMRFWNSSTIIIIAIICCALLMFAFLAAIACLVIFNWILSRR